MQVCTSKSILHTATNKQTLACQCNTSCLQWDLKLKFKYGGCKYGGGFQETIETRRRGKKLNKEFGN